MEYLSNCCTSPPDFTFHFDPSYTDEFGIFGVCNSCKEKAVFEEYKEEE